LDYHQVGCLDEELELRKIVRWIPSPARKYGIHKIQVLNLLQPAIHAYMDVYIYTYAYMDDIIMITFIIIIIIMIIIIATIAIIMVVILLTINDN
jgi:hypothetical protein